MKKYKIIDKGKRSGEEIIAILDDEGFIYKVASAYFDYKRNLYKLYPCSYRSYSTIAARMNVRLNEVQLK